MCQSVCSERRRALARMVGEDRWAHALHCTWVARPVRAAMAPPVGNGSRLGRRGSPSSVTTVSWASGRRARGSRVGRLELHGARLRHTRSGGCRLSDLRFQRMSGDRSCPLLSAVDPSGADPARTRPQIPADSRPVADASGALIREWPRRCKGRASCCGIRGRLRWSGRMRPGWPIAWATVCVAYGGHGALWLRSDAAPRRHIGRARACR